jgi:alcohol dehydrogenase
MEMIKDFEFLMPVKVQFGSGVSQQIGQVVSEYGGINVLVVTDPGLRKAGIVDPIMENIKNSGASKVILFDEVQPNPRDISVQKAYDIAKKESVDMLVAVGGGSSIDTAKGIGVLLAHGGHIRDYAIRRDGGDLLTNDIIPLIIIPTTVGTGSEVTAWAVITNTEKHYKMSIGGPKLYPKVALADPDLLETLPGHIIASTGMDALTHAIEGYTATVSGPITDACGIYAIELIANNIREAVFTTNMEAKANMLLGSLIAGICFGNSDTAGVHCMAESLGGLYDIPHGVANAILLPYVMEYNYLGDFKKFTKIAKALGEKIDNMSDRDAAYQSVLGVKKMNLEYNFSWQRKKKGREQSPLPLIQEVL